MVNHQAVVQGACTTQKGQHQGIYYLKSALGIAFLLIITLVTSIISMVPILILAVALVIFIVFRIKTIRIALHKAPISHLSKGLSFYAFTRNPPIEENYYADIDCLDQYMIQIIRLYSE